MRPAVTAKRVVLTHDVANATNTILATRIGVDTAIGTTATIEVGTERTESAPIEVTTKIVRGGA